MRHSRQCKRQRRVGMGERDEKVPDIRISEEVTVVFRSSGLLPTQSEMFSADCSTQRQLAIA